MEPNDEHIRKLTGSQNPEENFEVPDGYFDTFSSRVKEQITARQKPQKVSVFAWLLKPVITIPAATIALLVAGYFVFFNSQGTSGYPVAQAGPATVDTIVGPSDEAIEDYLAQDVTLLGAEDEVDDDLIAIAFETEDEAPAQVYEKQSKSKNDSLDAISDEEIEQYLLENTDELFDNL